MGRLGDLLKISTDSYKRLEVIYSFKGQIVVKNNVGKYAIAISDRDLCVGDILFYAIKSISGNNVLCNQLGKDYVVTLKMLSFSEDKEYVIEKLKEIQNILVKIENKKKEVKKEVSLSQKTITKNKIKKKKKEKKEYKVLYPVGEIAGLDIKKTHKLIARIKEGQDIIKLYYKDVCDNEISITAKLIENVNEFSSNLRKGAKLLLKSEDGTRYKIRVIDIATVEDKIELLTYSPPSPPSPPSHGRIIYTPMGGQKRY